MPKNNTDFDDFQKYFTEYQRRFGLTGYKTYFKHQKLEQSFASISINHHNMVVTVFLNTILLKQDEPHKDIKCSAKHEALHLLLGKLEREASSRYTIEEDVYEAVEELVHKLEELINDKMDC